MEYRSYNRTPDRDQYPRGGHAFHGSPEQLRPILNLAIATGAGMAFLETYPNLHFMIEGAGLLLIVKLALEQLFRE